MNETEELELDQWLHTVLLAKCWHDVGFDPEGFPLWDTPCIICREPLSADDYPFNPSYTTDLNLAAIVEAKAIETAGAERYLASLDRLCCDLFLETGDSVYDVRLYLTTASAITRCRAARAAVEG